MAYVLRGTVSFPAGSGQLTRYLDVPAVCVFGASGLPKSYLSSVKAADPADNDLFDHQGFGFFEGSGDPLGGYLGGRRFGVYYELTGGSDIDVEFEVVWQADGSDVDLQYGGN